MKYISIIHFEDDEFDVTTAITVDEAKKPSVHGSTASLGKMAPCCSEGPRFQSLNARLEV